MRALTALGLAALTAALGSASLYFIRLDAPAYAPYVVYFWLFIASLALVGLLWLYFQIAVGPRATVSQRTAMKLERALARTRAGRNKSRERREKKLTEHAAALSSLIEPATEARNVFKRRVRLTNAVLSLVFLLSTSFWIFAAMAQDVWPSERWFINARAPDAYHAALFSFDQVTRGTLFDLFDVFDWNVSGFHADPQNQWFSAFIVIYRFLIGGALVAAIVVRLGMHEDWHEKAAHASAEEMKARLDRLAGVQA
jgi:hypothetical protein